jgi:hypothetical protein
MKKMSLLKGSIHQKEMNPTLREMTYNIDALEFLCSGMITFSNSVKISLKLLSLLCKKEGFSMKMFH